MSEEWFNKTLGGQYKSAQATDQSEKQPSWRAPTQGPSTRDEQIASSGSYSGPSSSTGAFPGQVNASSAPLPAPQFQESRTIYHRQRTSSIPSSYQSAWPTPSQSAQEGSTPGWYTHPARNRSSYLDPFLLGPAPSTSAKTVAPSPAPPAAPPAQSKSPAPTPSANGDDSAPSPPKERRKGAQWTPEEDSEILAKTSFTETQNWKTLLPQIDLDRNDDTIKQRHSHLKRLHYYPEATRRYAHPLPSPTIGPRPSPDSTPWSPEEDAELLKRSTASMKTDWYGLQSGLGSGRSVKAIQDRVGLLVKLKLKAEKRSGSSQTPVPSPETPQGARPSPPSASGSPPPSSWAKSPALAPSVNQDTSLQRAYRQIVSPPEALPAPAPLAEPAPIVPTSKAVPPLPRPTPAATSGAIPVSTAQRTTTAQPAAPHSNSQAFFPSAPFPGPSPAPPKLPKCVGCGKRIRPKSDDAEKEAKRRK